MGDSAPLQQAKAIAAALEQLADQLRPEVIRAARLDVDGRRDLDRIEYALGTIGKALILTDYSIDEEKDIDKLKACLLYTSPSPRDATLSRMPSSA